MNQSQKFLIHELYLLMWVIEKYLAAPLVFLEQFAKILDPTVLANAFS